MDDDISKQILDVMKSSHEPLETQEILSCVKTTRTKLLYRLQNLRAERKINGKLLHAAKGVWVWWQVH